MEPAPKSAQAAHPQVVEKTSKTRRFDGYDEHLGLAEPPQEVDLHSGEPMALPPQSQSDDLLVPIYRHGQLVYEAPSIHQSQARTREQLRHLREAVKRLREPDRYHVGLEQRLHEQKCELIASAMAGERGT